MLNIEEKADYRFALHHLGFRPFFLLAGVFAVLLILVWARIYHASNYSDSIQAAVTWHGHEMIYGYGLAVISGFLLTAVRNWTGVQTLHGIPLLLLASIWLVARICALLTTPWALFAMATADLLFGFLLILAISYPILKVKQWTQAGIVLLLILLLLANGRFYFGMFNGDDFAVQTGLYGGLYIIIFLILIMGRRVIPFFIEKGVDIEVKLVNRRWLDVSSLILMILFVLSKLFTDHFVLTAIIASVLGVLLVIRLYDWHTPALWKKPLLWSLYIAYAWIVLGFAIEALAYVLPLNLMFATHAFAYGGIGLMTLSMMCRVSLGHTGRNVFEPPALLQWLFIMMTLGAVVRVILPIIVFEHYTIWIGISQGLWILAFGLFVIIYTPMLIKPRIDGRYG
jgi:uncharacterized protein involved in response to NO